MAICHRHCLSEEKANVQHVCQHTLVCQKKTENLKPALHLRDPEVPKTWATVREILEEKLAVQVENISQKQNTSSKICLNGNFPHFSYQES